MAILLTATATASLGGHHVLAIATVPLVVLCMGATVIDLAERRIPNPLVAFGASSLVAIGVVATVIDSRPQVLIGLTVGSVVAGGPLLVAHLISPVGIGFGDVKLAFALGGFLGLINPLLGAPMLALASLAAGGAALSYRPWRTRLPFGVFLSVSTLVVYALGGSITQRIGL